MKELCRICLEGFDKEELISLINNNQDELTFSGEIFEKCLGIKINTEQEYQICIECKIQLNYFNDFKEKALDANKKLMKLYFEKQESNNKSCLDNDTHSKVEFLEAQSDNDSSHKAQETEFLDIPRIEKKKALNCPICDKPFSIQSILNNHLQTHNKTNSYKCLECNGKYKTRISLNAHLRTMHSDGFLCNLCGKSFHRKQYLKIHIKNHATSLTGCDSKTDLQSHPFTEVLNNKKQKRLTFPCDVCGKRLLSLEGHSSHMRNHFGLPGFECKECSKKFNLKNSLIYHTLSYHKNERNFQCELCPKNFVSNGSLKIHMRMHNNERPYTCDICDKRFRAYSHMTDHRYTHFEKSIKCPHCVLLFISPRTLQSHIRNIHEGYCAYQCNNCDRKFKKKPQLIEHYKIHETDRVLAYNQDLENNTTEAVLEKMTITNNSEEKK